MKSGILNSIPTAELRDLARAVLSGLDLGESQTAGAEYSIGSGINAKGRVIHVSVDYSLYSRFQLGGYFGGKTFPHGSGAYVLISALNLDLATCLLEDRRQTPSIVHEYQLARASNNPSRQQDLFPLEAGASRFFGLLCFGRDPEGPFAFIHLPSSGLYELERRDLPMVEAMAIEAEERPTVERRFQALPGEKKASS